MKIILEAIGSTFRDGPMGVVMGLVLSATVMLVVGLIGWFLFWAVDSWFQPVYTEPATVNGKSFTAAHTTTTMMQCGKMMVPQTIHHPDCWSVSVCFVRGFGGWCDVGEKTYQDLEKGSAVMASFKVGRLSKSCYVQQIVSY